MCEQRDQSDEHTGVERELESQRSGESDREMKRGRRNDDECRKSHRNRLRLPARDQQRPPRQLEQSGEQPDRTRLTRADHDRSERWRHQLRDARADEQRSRRDSKDTPRA